MAGFDRNANDQVLAAALGNSYYDQNANDEVLRILGQPTSGNDDLMRPYDPAFARAVVGAPPPRQSPNEERAPGGPAPQGIRRAPAGVSPEVAGATAPGALSAQPVAQLPELAAPPPGYTPPVAKTPPVGPPGARPARSGPTSPQDAIDQQAGQEMKDTAALAEEEAAATQQGADLNLRATAEHAKAAVDQQAMLVTAKAKTDAQLADIQARSEALMRAEPDPERWWTTRSTGQKVSALVSMALGGVLQMEFGGSNMALDIIQKAIDRDIDAQKVGFENQKAGLEMKSKGTGAQIQSDQQMFNDLAAAEDTRYQGVIEMIKAQVAAYHGAPEVLKRGQIAIDKLQGTRNENQEKLRQQLFKEHVDQQRVNIEGANAATARGHLDLDRTKWTWGMVTDAQDRLERVRMDNATIAEKEAKAGAAALKAKGTAIGGIGGEGDAGIVYADKEGTTAIRKAQVATQNFIQAEQDMTDLRQQYPGKSLEWVTKKVGPQKMRAIKAAIVSGYANVIGIHRLSETDLKLWSDAMVGDFNTIWQGAGSAAQDESIKIANDMFNNTLNTYAPDHGKGPVVYSPVKKYWQPAAEAAQEKEADSQAKQIKAPDTKFDRDAAERFAAADVIKKYDLDPSFVRAIIEDDVPSSEDPDEQANLRAAKEDYNAELASLLSGGTKAAAERGQREFNEKVGKVKGGGAKAPVRPVRPSYKGGTDAPAAEDTGDEDLSE